MKKYLLTPEGAKALQSELYTSANEQLHSEAISIAEDTRGWIAAHFELSTDQLEFMRGIAEDFILILGWTLAAAVLSRRPFTLDDMGGVIGNGFCRKANIEITTTINSRYNCDTASFTTTGNSIFAFS